MKYNIVIAGSGITGATIAAMNADKRILIIEKAEIGGLCRTENMGGIEVHRHGKHVFHTDNKDVWNFVNRYAEFNGYVHQEKSMVDDRLLPFPINLDVYSSLYNTTDPMVAAGLITEGVDINAEDYMVDKIGIDLYDKFFKGYIEKKWGMPARDLPAFIAKQYPVRSTYDSRYYTDRYQGVPVLGYTTMIEQMIEHCDIQAGNFCDDREYYESLADTIIYTGSIDEYFDYELGELPYRSAEHFINIEPTADFQGIAQVNFPDEAVAITSRVEHKHMSPVDTAITVTTDEYPRTFRRGHCMKRMLSIPLPSNHSLWDDYNAMDHKAVFAGSIATYRNMSMAECVLEAMKINESL